MKEKTSDTQNEEKKKDAGALLARALIFLFAAGTAVGAVLCLGNAFDAENLSLKIVLFVSGPLLAVASGLSWIVFAAASNPVRRNLFLYDRETKSEIPVEELTWERIEDRLAGCFAYYFRSRRLLAAMPPVLNPLFLPFYLLQFREAEDPDVDRLLKNKEMIDAAGLALNTLGLDDDGRQLLYHFGAYEGDVAPFHAFLDAAAPRIRDKITEYVKTHIEEFV